MYTIYRYDHVTIAVFMFLHAENGLIDFANIQGQFVHDGSETVTRFSNWVKLL